MAEFGAKGRGALAETAGGSSIHPWFVDYACCHRSHYCYHCCYQLATVFHYDYYTAVMIVSTTIMMSIMSIMVLVLMMMMIIIIMNMSAFSTAVMFVIAIVTGIMLL